LFIYINKLTKIVNNLHTNFDSVTYQDHKITKKTRLNRIKTTLKSQKSVLKKVAHEYAAKD